MVTESLQIFGNTSWWWVRRGEFEWANHSMHGALDTEVLPGEWQGVHGHCELFWGITDTLPGEKPRYLSFCLGQHLTDWNTPEFPIQSSPQCSPIFGQTLDYSPSMIWKYGLYLICPGIKAAGTFCWSLMEIHFILGISLTKLAVYISIHQSGREMKRSPQGTDNGEIATFKMKPSS